MMKKAKVNKIIFFGMLIIITGFVIGYYFLSYKKLPQNVILITIDSLRSDHLGCYGYKRDTSPNIDKFAKNGIMFTQAISQGPDTQASVPSFITSTYPYRHIEGSRGHITYLNPHANSLIKELKNNGYKTILFSDHGSVVGDIHSIKNDIDVCYAIKRNQPKQLSQLALKWLRGKRNKKFFLWLYYLGPHGPYNKTPYSEIFLNDGLSKIQKNIPLANNGNEKFGVIPKYIAEDNITDVNYYIANYDGNIRFVDDQIGLLLKGIEGLGMDKNTLIIILADHGENLGDHNLYFRHGFELYDELLRVPLIMNCPFFIPKQRIINHQVRLIDLMPTVIDILGIKTNNKMEGSSLKCYLTTEKYKLKVEQFAFSNDVDIYSIRTEKWKLIYDAKAYTRKIEHELYNLEKDSLETYNLIFEQPEIFNDLKHRLDEYIIKAKEESTKIQQLYINESYKDSPLDKKTKEELRALGYIQ